MDQKAIVRHRLYLTLSALSSVWLVGAVLFGCWLAWSDYSYWERKKTAREDGTAVYLVTTGGSWVDQYEPEDAQTKLAGWGFRKATKEEIDTYLRKERRYDEARPMQLLQVVFAFLMIGVVPLLVVVGGRRWWRWLHAPARPSPKDQT